MKQFETIGVIERTKTNKNYSLLVSDGESWYYLEPKSSPEKYDLYNSNITYTNIGEKNHYYYNKPTPESKVGKTYLRRFGLSNDGQHYKHYTGFKVAKSSVAKWLSSKDNTYIRDEKSQMKKKDGEDSLIELFNFQYAGGKFFINSTEKVEVLTRLMFSIIGATKEEIALLKEADLPLDESFVCEDAHLIKTHLQQVAV